MQAWLVDGAGKIVSSRAPQAGITLKKDDESDTLSVATGEQPSPGQPLRLEFVLGWTDGAGKHEERSEVRAHGLS